MNEWWPDFQRQLILLTTIFPLLGVLSIMATSRWGKEIARHIALANSWMTCLLSLVLLASFLNYEHPPGIRPLFPLSVSYRWLGQLPVIPSGEVSSAHEISLLGPDVRLAFGVDGISVTLLALLAMLFACGLTSASRSGSLSPGRYALLLLLHSTLMGVFVALDIVLLLIFLEAATWTAVALIGLWGNHGRMPGSGRILLFQLAGSLFIETALIALVLTHSLMGSTFVGLPEAVTFSLQRTLTEIPQLIMRDQLVGQPLASLYFSQIEALIAVLLVVGCLLRMGVFPFHIWIRDVLREAPPLVAVLVIAGLMKAGLYLLIRFIPTVFATWCLQTGPFWASWGVIALTYAAVTMWSHDDPADQLADFCCGQMGLCLLGIFVNEPAGIVGVMWIIVNHALAVTLIWLHHPRINGRQENRTDVGELSAAGRWLIVLGWLSLSGLLPLLPGFHGMMLLFVPGFRFATLLTGWALLMLLLMAVRLFRSLDVNRPTDSVSKGTATFPWALLPIGVMLIVFGLFPRLLTSIWSPQLRKAPAPSAESQSLRTAAPVHTVLAQREDER